MLPQPPPPPPRSAVLIRLEDVEKTVARWRRTWPDLVHPDVLGTTRQGRPIRLVRLGPGKTAPEHLPETLLIAGIHPREQQPTLCLLRLAEELLAAHGKDPSIGDLLDRQTLWIVPAFNPDGKAWEQDHPDWRKNRAPHPSGAVGVDLNRNFGVRWGGARALDPLWRATTDAPDADIFEGSAPLSEPETRALADFFERRPNLRAFVDLHSPLREILCPPYVPAGDGLRFARLIEGMRREQDVPYAGPTLRLEQTPPPAERAGNSGLTYHHAYYLRGVFALNVEIGTPSQARGVEGRYPARADVAREYDARVRGPLLDLLFHAPSLPPTRPGAVRALGPGRAVGPLAPGAVVGWFPPALDGRHDWAVLVSPRPEIQVLSEVRYAPFDQPFTLRVHPDARPGDVVPLTLVVWDRDRRRTVLRVDARIAAP